LNCDPSEAEFYRWWDASKYAQLVYLSNAQQIALDGWKAHERLVEYRDEEARAEKGKIE
jgi:hypothetical protein